MGGDGSHAIAADHFLNEYGLNRGTTCDKLARHRYDLPHGNHPAEISGGHRKHGFSGEDIAAYTAKDHAPLTYPDNSLTGCCSQPLFAARTTLQPFRRQRRMPGTPSYH